MNNRYIVILAGGKGERLWPLSRQKKPKQLLPFQDKSLLEHTIERFSFIAKENIIVITTADQYTEIATKIRDKVGAIIKEPEGRNTAVAILLATFIIQKQDPQAILCFVPADHVITDKDSFESAILSAFSIADQEDAIVLIGVKPLFPATGYGYIEYHNNNMQNNKNYYPVKRFHEKPSASTAALYFSLDSMLWNIGINVASTNRWIQQYTLYAPHMIAIMHEYLQKSEIGIYKKFDSISVDYAILERTDCALVLPAHFGWSDVGNLETFITYNETNKKKNSEILEIDAYNNILYGSKKITIFLEVDNLCVVETDDAVLITKKDKTENVKKVVQFLSQKGYERYV